MLLSSFSLGWNAVAPEAATPGLMLPLKCATGEEGYLYGGAGDAVCEGRAPSPETGLWGINDQANILKAVSLVKRELRGRSQCRNAAGAPGGIRVRLESRAEPRDARTGFRGPLRAGSPAVPGPPKRHESEEGWVHPSPCR